MRLKNILPTGLAIVGVGLVVFFVFRGRFEKIQPNTTVRLDQVQAFILPLSEITYLPVRNFNIGDPTIDARAAGLFDVYSEKMLYAKNINERLPIASITKLMTALVIMENLPLSDIYTVAVEDINVDGNGADLKRGEEIKGGDLLKIMLIKSSNDAALVFADNAAKKYNLNLVAKMNEKSKMFGMYDTKFADPAGLEDSNSYSTVADLIKLVKKIETEPIIWETLSIKTADVSSVDGSIQHHLINTNKLLDEMNNIIGGKTGNTDGALQTMVLEVAINNGRNKLISVILGSRDRFGETKKLIDWGLEAYRW